MTKRLTVKQLNFVKEKAKGKTGTQAVIDAGYKVSNIKTAEVIGSENLSKPIIQKALDQALLKHDITLENSLIPIAKGLKAKRITEVEGDYFTTEVDDLDMQLKASDRALKLLGISGSTGNNTAFINVINLDKDKYQI